MTMAPTTLAHYVCLFTDLMMVGNGVFIVIAAALYHAGIRRENGASMGKAVMIVANALMAAAWFIWRPTF